MTKRYLVLCTAAFIAACSGSTAPSSNNSGNSPKNPGNASKGDSVDLTGTYNLGAFVFDSTDGHTATYQSDANDGGSLTLSTTTYSLAWTGTFLTNDQDTHGSYEAVDTSSSAQRGTIALYDSVKAKTQDGVWTLSNDTLTVSLPDGGGDGTDVTIWIKQ